MRTLCAEAFALGLSTGPYCLSACAPLLFPYLLGGGQEGWKRQLAALAEFLGGRLAAYLLFGAAAGALGAAALQRLPAALVGGAILASGLLLLAVFAVETFPQASLCAWALRRPVLRRAPFLLGFAVGINLCPPFVAGFLRAAGSGGAGSGALYFLSFFAGTSLFLLPFVAAVPMSAVERLRAVGRLACGLSGLWLCGQGLFVLLKSYNLFR
ncbi:MAG: sulfite exporter TauE/SafE family protein [Elusimicrobiota bacterium]|jgi:sulfite exporter TauE/SafE